MFFDPESSARLLLEDGTYVSGILSSHVIDKITDLFDNVTEQLADRIINYLKAASMHELVHLADKTYFGWIYHRYRSAKCSLHRDDPDAAYLCIIQLNKDFIAIFPFQGPKQNGMPELHQLTPTLTILQRRGFKVGLITDGRMSGASGKIPAAIHVVPEAKDGGLISKIQTGDIILMNAITGELKCMDQQVNNRDVRTKENSNVFGLGRELFFNMRTQVSSSEEGASFL